MREVTLAATQMTCSKNSSENIDKAERIIPDDDEPSSYINFYIANDAIIFPIFGDKQADENAEKVIKSQFPNRQIVCLDGRDILLGGGNIHCITQQQPRSVK